MQQNVAGEPTATYTPSHGTLTGGSGTNILGVVHSPKDKFTGKVSAVPSPTLAPCTKPLPGPLRDCTSTSPTVDRWYDSAGGDEACTFAFTIDWGDGTPDWSGIVTDPPPGWNLLASHNYNSGTQASYKITVQSSVVAGSCTAPPTTVFGFTHLLLNTQPWWTALSVSKACVKDLTPNPLDVGLTLADLGETIGVFEENKAWGVAFAVLELATHVKAVDDVVFKMPQDCIDKAYSLGALPQALAYGASHPGEVFKPKSGLAAVPQITSVGAYQNGVLDYFRLTYSDPGDNAKGFGFVGIKGPAGRRRTTHSPLPPTASSATTRSTIHSTCSAGRPSSTAVTWKPGSTTPRASEVTPFRLP